MVRLFICLAATVLGGCSWSRPFDVASGMVSHNLCSEVFVSGMKPQQAYEESLAPRSGMGLIDWAVDYDVDRSRKQVSTTLAGGFASRAVYRGRLGCLVVHGAVPDDEPLAVDAMRSDSPLPEIAGPDVVEPGDERLRAALDHAFEETSNGAPRRTRAVVVVHDGRVVAERYAPGLGVASPLLGYSATKSAISALIGILVRDGRLCVDQPAPVAAWAAADDPRHIVTVDHLLRMTSGLALDESGSPLSPVGRMLYVERDMAGFAEDAELQDVPGRQWNYTSGNTIILSRIVRDAVGGNAGAVLDFARRELFEPLGMRGVTLELDAVGTPVGSTYMLAPARDWARFGMLYLADGVVAGRRLLPEGWVSYSTTPTLDTGYGAGWWTNRVDGHIPWSSVRWNIPGVPRDAFYARGLLGQYVVVVPSERLVVVRFGASHDSGQDIDGVGRLIGEVIESLHADDSRRGRVAE